MRGEIGEQSAARKDRRRSRNAMPYWIASMLTNVPVRRLLGGTVIDRKKCARFRAFCRGRNQSVRTFSMMWMPLSVSSVL